MNWNKIKTLVLTALGITSIAENKLTAEQEETIKLAYGENVLAKFKEGLAAENPQDHAKAIHEAMKAFFAPEAEEATNGIAAQLEASIAENKRKDSLIEALMASAEEIPNPETNEFQGKAGVPKVMSVLRKAGHYAAAFGFLATGSMISAQGKTMDVDAVRQEFGTYLSMNGNNLEIVRQLFNGFTSSKYFKSVPAVTEHRAVQAQINSVVQQFTPKWTPKGNTKFTPLVIKNRRHKINVPIIPAEVLDSYLFHLYDERLSPDQMPITKYIWEQLIYPQILDDIELRMIFKGKYVENADPNTPTDPEDSMDGIETILVSQKALGAASKVNFTDATINWDTATAEQILAFFESFVDKLTPLYKNKKMNIYVSPEVYRKYQRSYKKVWGQNSGQDGDFGTAKIDYSVNTLVALDGMSGSPIVFSTPDGNMVKLRHKNEVPNVINDVQKHDYEVRLFGEFWLGVGFQIAEAVFAYVPAGYDPQAGLRPSNQFPDGSAPVEEPASAGGAGGI
ncbi:hypothetical protein [Sphingobacterium lactis]|uniref:Uncharacterized protein n=1 Tax=Sphingobacterium lactis TaxID=797291 RepID=A0A1H6BQ23_9SPHI|nr:hypothetical protein [Sphingobacterium lactis]SEG62732.1 hypothetical protein SAMN05421877_11149 [Sphingobacterium lactis]